MTVSQGTDCPVCGERCEPSVARRRMSLLLAEESWSDQVARACGMDRIVAQRVLLDVRRELAALPPEPVECLPGLVLVR